MADRYTVSGAGRRWVVTDLALVAGTIATSAQAADVRGPDGVWWRVHTDGTAQLATPTLFDPDPSTPPWVARLTRLITDLKQ